MATYSFETVTASITGIGGSFNLAAGAAAAEEGITFEATDDKNVMTIGADGSFMHNLRADRSGTVTVRLLKTSPVNQQLQLMYNVQTADGGITGHGLNVVTLRDNARGDFAYAEGVAFARQPTLNYATEGGIMEWTFHAGRIIQSLGSGTPERAGNPET